MKRTAGIKTCKRLNASFIVAHTNSVRLVTANGAPDSEVRFAFNGVELRQSYGVNDGDSIIGIPADQTDSIITTHQGLSLTRDSDTSTQDHCSADKRRCRVLLQPPHDEHGAEAEAVHAHAARRSSAKRRDRTPFPQRPRPARTPLPSTRALIDSSTESKERFCSRSCPLQAGPWRRFLGS